MTCAAQAPGLEPARTETQSTSTGACSPIINSNKATNLTFNCILGRHEYKATAAELEDRAARFAELGYYEDAVATYDDLIKGLIVANKTPFSRGTRTRLAALLVKEARVLLKDSKPDLALLRLQHALKVESDHHEATVEIQKALRRLGRNLEAAQLEAAGIFRAAQKGDLLNSRRLTQLLGDFVSSRSTVLRHEAYQLCEFYRLQVEGGLPKHACFPDPPDKDAVGKSLVEALVSLVPLDYYGEAHTQNKERSDAAFRRAAELASELLADKAVQNSLAIAALSNRAAYVCRTKPAELEKERAAAYIAAERMGFAPPVLSQFRSNLEYQWTGSRAVDVMLVQDGAWFETYAPNCSYVLPSELTSGIAQ
jgi:hypothetical protein